METRNITLNLPSDLVRKAKIHAAEHDTSINAFVRTLLEEALSGETKAQEAANRLLAAAEKGTLSFNADRRSMRREDLYDRR